jgi:hypothetical protein
MLVFNTGANHVMRADAFSEENSDTLTPEEGAMGAVHELHGPGPSYNTIIVPVVVE